jgi:hypothetical protein
MVDSEEKSIGTMDLKTAKPEGIFSWQKRDKFLSNIPNLPSALVWYPESHIINTLSTETEVTTLSIQAYLSLPFF